MLYQEEDKLISLQESIKDIHYRKNTVLRHLLQDLLSLSNYLLLMNMILQQLR